MNAVPLRAIKAAKSLQGNGDGGQAIRSRTRSACPYPALHLRTCVTAVFAIVILLAAPEAFAQPAKRWAQASQADFESGKREDIALTSIGELKLARRKEVIVEEADDQVWALAMDSKGIVYAATGSKGRIVKITDGKGELFYKSEEAEILCLAVDNADNLYAGTAPNGLIYKLSPDGDVEVYLDSEEPYIWGLALDSKGTLYAATGDKGKLLKIAKKDDAKTVFETDTPHLLDVVTDSKDNAYVCTSTGGLIFRIAPDGKPFALFDSEDEEMHRLAVDENDNLYACTADGMQPGTAGLGPRGQPDEQPQAATQPGPAEAKEADGPDGPKEPDAEDPAPGPDVTQEAPPGPRKPDAVAPPIAGINFVYKISPDGMVTSIFTREGMALLAIACHGPDVYVGTGSKGQLLRINDELQVTILTQVEQPQLPSLVVAPNGTLYFGTAGDGKVYRVDNKLADEGTFTSMVKDMAYPSQWGMIRRTADVPDGASVAIATRTGNVAEPDATWSDWSNEDANPAGAMIASPHARFLQYRLLMKAPGQDTPTVRSVEMYYLPPNYRPRITAIVFPPSTDGQAPPEPTPTGSVAATQKAAVAPMCGTVEIGWEAKDPNEDNLEFEVFFKGIGEATWKSIEDELRKPGIKWRTVRVPDGIYRLKVTATDTPSNPPGRALATEEISEPFIIDNTPPSVSDIKIQIADDGSMTIAARLADTASPIQDAVYSIDSADWVMLSPADGIFDSKQEAVEFTTEALSPGERTIVINTRDSAGNIGAGKQTVTVPKR